MYSANSRATTKKVKKEQKQKSITDMQETENKIKTTNVGKE